MAGLAVRGLGGRPRVFVTGVMAGVAARSGQVVAARAIDRHVAGKVRFARIGEGLVRCRGRRDVLGEHARFFESGGAHLVAGCVMTALAGALGGVLGVVEARCRHLDVLVTVEAALVRYFGHLGKREPGVAEDVLLGLTQGDDLVLEPLHHAVVDVTAHARDPRVRSRLPRVGVRLHLVACRPAELGTVGRAGGADECEAEKRDGDHGEHGGECRVRSCPTRHASHGVSFSSVTADGREVA